MNKSEYSQLQMLLAKLKFDLAIERCEAPTDEYAELLEEQIEAVDEVMKIFRVDLKKK